MIWILIMTSSVYGIDCIGMLAVKGAPTLYQAEENNNITIKWASQNETGMTHTNLHCVLQSKPVKILYEITNGVEVSESQDKQFAGRVQFDEDALREGRLRLHLSRVTTDDSGKYQCNLTANYDKITKSWGLEASVHLILDVIQTSHGNNSEVSTSTPWEAANVVAKHHRGGPKQRHGRSYYLSVIGPALAAVALAALVVYGLYLATPAVKPLVIIVNRHRHQHQHRHHQHEGTSPKFERLNSKLLQV
ncbi:uncharacterized protein LOC121889352 [Scomber scombrus]|uniref:Uncharacterized protein LOC121889352 n=1 Tax=Scomber scombrus TaxID=13677 RepID=A0AAV1QDG5_SCOSC